MGESSFPGLEWEIETPQSQDVDPTALEAAVAYLNDHSGPDGVRELFIVRNGRVVWQGDNVRNRHGVWSVTKSFASTVLGLLLDDRKATLDTRAKDYVPALAEAYPAVTLRHLVTMTSGYRAMGDEPHGSYVHGPSETFLTPDPTPMFAPGTMYAYWDSAANLHAAVLTCIAQEPIRRLFQRRIADKIGLAPDRWVWGDYGTTNGLLLHGGAGNHNRHVQISACDLARLGLLFLNRGVWNGEPVISSQWVAAATSVQVPVDLPLLELVSHIDGRGVYGYGWWTNGLSADGARKWPKAPVGTAYASGKNNNRMFIIPEWNMVIVRLGQDGYDRENTHATYAAFLAKIQQAIGNIATP